MFEVVKAMEMDTIVILLITSLLKANKWIDAPRVHVEQLKQK